MAEAVATTERLVLRPWREDDRADWSRHLNTDEVRVHMGGAFPPEEVDAAFARLVNNWPTKGFGMLAIERRADGMLLGFAGYGPITTAAAPAEMRGGPEVGYQLRADARGQGYATEAARTVLDLIFARTEAPVPWGQTSEANARSGAVFRRLGLTLRPGLAYDDPDYEPQENPTQVWSMRREDWPCGR